MEDVLEVYQQPYDPKRPQVCFDEGSVQFTSDLVAPLDMRPGQVQKIDYHYQRDGYCNVFLACEPLSGHRVVQVTERRTKVDFAHFVRSLLQEQYAQADKVVLVMDNLRTHTLGALYAAFPAQEARRLCQRLEIHYTPVHGSWLNMAEIELSVLGRQVLQERLADRATVERKVAAWQVKRNAQQAIIHWRFTTADARIKLTRLYPVIEAIGSKQKETP